jgi:hypothetical protein
MNDIFEAADIKISDSLDLLYTKCLVLIDAEDF